MKSVVIASGKGGTGKTTLASAFARLASVHSKIVLVDADVEASNLPIALGAETQRCESFPGQGKVFIDPKICSGCSACELICAFGALSFDMRQGVFVVDQSACERCGFCAYVCPLGAVRTVETIVGQACVGTTPTGPIAFGNLEPGEDLSGRLVSEVRRLGAELATQGEADLVLIDGPPGIGCPVVASLADTDLLVAVAEPTVSGEHDLGRIVELARGFGLPVRVVLNKADLSAQGAERIRQLCRERELPIVAEIPFDPKIAALVLTDDAWPSRPTDGVAEVMRAWSRIEADISAIENKR